VEIWKEKIKVMKTNQDCGGDKRREGIQKTTRQLNKANEEGKSMKRK
jgi:hypothetical protein